VDYLPRLIDTELDEALSSLPAVCLDGAKGVGKTVTATRRAQVVFRLDEPTDREILAADPGQLEAEPGTILIDEWQRLPVVWDHVRRQVDAGAAPGRYLLAGSAAPAEAPVHSGAGRIVSLRLRPLSLAERGLAPAAVSLTGLLSGEKPAIRGRSDTSLADYVREITASGFPGIRTRSEPGQRAQLAGDLDRVVERDFPDQGLRIRRPQTLRAWLATYAAATATTTSYNALLAAATPGETDKPAKTTTIAYRDVLSQLWLLDPVPAWTPGGGRLSRLGVAPKHHLADPALATALLNVDADALLQGSRSSKPPAVTREGTLLGALFESLATLSVRVYAHAAGAGTYHMRTQNGDHEIDLILQRRDGKVVACEVKLAATAGDADTKHLHWLAERLGDDLLDAAVITTGTRAYRRSDGIAVIPAALLGP
jgi:predicted AAA+ superfamily ATPase